MKRMLSIGMCLLIGLLSLPAFLPAPGIPVFSRSNSMPPVIMEVLDPSLRSFGPLWRDEIARRPELLPAVGILCHGGDIVAGEWHVGSSDQPWKHISKTTDVVRKYQKLYPNRTIVLLACNTGHLTLGIPGVYYAHSSVWCIPDRALKPSHFTEMAFRKLDDPEDLVDVINKVINETTRWQEEPDVVGNIFEFKKD